MSPEQLLREYFQAKDENRPHLLVSVFTKDARLEIINKSDQIAFPAVTIGAEGIAEVLVRRFNQTYENIRSFYLDRPGPGADAFTCDWLVGMTDKATGNVRVGCGRYDWTFHSRPVSLVSRLVVTIEQMVVLAPTRTADVMRGLMELTYPWTSAALVARALPQDELAPVNQYIARA